MENTGHVLIPLALSMIFNISLCSPIAQSGVSKTKVSRLSIGERSILAGSVVMLLISQVPSS